MTYPVIFSFLRIGTSTRAFPKPYTLEEAAAHIVAWLDQPATRILTPGPTHALEVVQLLTTAGSSGGNLVTDAQIAAIAITYGGVVHTADRDFMRFKELKMPLPSQRQNCLKHSVQLRHQRNRVRLKQTLVSELTASEDHLQKLSIVGGCRK